jgi:hypothetical protein
MVVVVSTSPVAAAAARPPVTEVRLAPAVLVGRVCDAALAPRRHRTVATSAWAAVAAVASTDRSPLLVAPRPCEAAAWTST